MICRSGTLIWCSSGFPCRHIPLLRAESPSHPARCRSSIKSGQGYELFVPMQKNDAGNEHRFVGNGRWSNLPTWQFWIILRGRTSVFQMPYSCHRPFLPRADTTNTKSGRGGQFCIIPARPVSPSFGLRFCAHSSQTLFDIFSEYFSNSGSSFTSDIHRAGNKTLNTLLRHYYSFFN